MTDLSGQYLGRYYLKEQLGEGGMAVVYKAYDTRLERDVAVKIIRSAFFSSEELEQVLKRFEREAKSLAKLSHPNIVKVHDFGEHDGSPYLVMEYLPGGTLKKMLGKPIPWRDAVRLVLPIARGVAYAHQSGVLHRDIKPANILITASGEPMLSDFGIAKLFEEEHVTSITGSGNAIGTPEYMAPEQWNGITSPQSDLYSLGIVLYELVTGRKPYVADTPAAILIKQATEPLPGPRKFNAELPEDLEFVLIKTLAKEPGDRYQNVNSFIDALENLRIGTSAVHPVAQKNIEVTNGLAAQKPAASVPPHPLKFSRKGTGLLVGGIAVVLVVLLSLPVINNFFSPVPVVTDTATTVPTLTAQPISPTNTIEPSPEPTPTASSTATPLQAEITDEKNVKLVLVPEGEFTMGSDNGDSDERPIHQVFLDTFYIDKYEVTNALYKICVDSEVCSQPYNTDKFENPRYAQHPVVYVDWNMAKTYCEWRGARLPTEAEWEKAARGTDGRTYPWGETIYVTYANYSINIGDTTIVGDYIKGVSPYGGYDMAGNAWEWVADWYDKNYYELSPSSNPLGPEVGESKVLRGGGWMNLAGDVRSAFRSRNNPVLTDKDVGFRCARDVSP